MFSSNDYKKTLDMMENIKTEAIIKFKNVCTPSYDEEIKINQHIMDYLKKNKRIVYGGVAHNLYANGKIYDTFKNTYFNNNEIVDIEFYSYTPIKDSIELSESLLSLNYEYIEIKEALKKGTFKLFVNFNHYCDITFMPRSIYKGVKTKIIKDINCIDIYFSFIDTYRVLNDPLTSYWRLDKTIKRAQILMGFYNFDSFSKTIVNEENNKIDNLLKIFKSYSNIIYIGYYAYKLITKEKINIPYLEIIIENINDKKEKIIGKIKKHFKNVSIKYYEKYFQFLDNRIEIYIDNKLSLIIYGNNNRCIVYNNYDNKIKIGTFSLIIMFFLINFFNYKNKEFLYPIGNLYKIRREKNISIFDNTLYKEFVIDCIGKTCSDKYANFINNINNKRFNYKPNGKKTIINWEIDEINEGKEIKI